MTPEAQIFGGIGQECESINHLAIDQIVLCTARSILALPGARRETAPFRGRRNPVNQNRAKILPREAVWSKD
jgi:hypothetical protein